MKMAGPRRLVATVQIAPGGVRPPGGFWHNPPPGGLTPSGEDSNRHQAPATSLSSHPGKKRRCPHRREEAAPCIHVP